MLLGRGLGQNWAGAGTELGGGWDRTGRGLGQNWAGAGTELGGYNGIRVIHLKNLGLPEHIYSPFDATFHDLILKKHSVAVSHLTVTL